MRGKVVPIHHSRRPKETRSFESDGGGDGLPQIVVDLGNIPGMTEQALRALVADDAIYQSRGELVTVCKEIKSNQEGATPQTIYDVVGVPRIKSVSKDALLVHLARVARWVKWRRGQGTEEPTMVATLPDSHVVSAVHDHTTNGVWYSVRPLNGVTEVPVLAPSGRVVVERGYDDETCIVYAPSIDVPALKDVVTQEDAAEALKLIWTELFCDFPYDGMGETDPNDVDRHQRYAMATGNPGAFVGVAALLTVFARPAINGACPGFIFDAAQVGSGKTLQIHEISMVATGRTADPIPFPIYDDEVDEAELDKRISSFALSGERILCFDNIKCEVKGGSLEMLLTAKQSISMRVLGKSSYVVIPWIGIVAFSGNNMTMSNDVLDRTLRSRLLPDNQDRRKRDKSLFRHPDMIAWIESNRGTIIHACLTILKAAVAAGISAPSCGNWGSFDEWANLIPRAIAFAGGPNVLDARPKSDDCDSGENSAHSMLMREWAEHFKEPVRAKDVVKECFSQEQDILSGKTAQDGFDDMRSAIRELTGTSDRREPSAAALAAVMKRLQDSWRDGRRIRSGRDRKGFVTWRIETR